MLYKFRIIYSLIASIVLFIISLFPIYSVQVRIILLVLSMLTLALSTMVIKRRDRGTEKENIRNFKLGLILLNVSILFAITDVIMYGIYFI